MQPLTALGFIYWHAFMEYVACKDVGGTWVLRTTLLRPSSRSTLLPSTTKGKFSGSEGLACNACESGAQVNLLETEELHAAALTALVGRLIRGHAYRHAVQHSASIFHRHGRSLEPCSFPPG